MKCITCGFDNEAREAYCRACGAKLTLTLDEVEVDLIGKADRQNEEATEEEVRRWLVAAICLFLFALTAKVMYGPATWPTNYVVPSSSLSADYASVRYEHVVELKYTQAPLPK